MNEYEMNYRLSLETLRTYVERAEVINAERKRLAGDLRDLYAEAEHNDIDVNGLKALIRIRALDPNERRVREALVNRYLSVLGYDRRDFGAGPSTDETSFAPDYEPEASN
jgi:uncharacterized protein (UPF0335 family)